MRSSLSTGGTSKRGRVARTTALTAVALVLTSCGSGDAEQDPAQEQPSPTSSPSPSSTVAVPSGVSLTAVGEDLSFGESARVIYEPDKKHGTVLDLTVTAAKQGTTRDLSDYILNDYARAATPYFVDVTVENVGEGRVGGSAVPLWGVDGENTLLPPATFTTTFRKCPSKPLPTKFKPGETLDTCLVFLAPDQGTMEKVSFRPNQEFDPIEWTGEIATPKPEPKKQPEPKQKPDRKKG
jgi:hypothetical protein